MFQIEYNIQDYTLDPPPVMLFGEDDKEMADIIGAIYGVLPKAYKFTIQVGDYLYAVKKEHIHTVTRDIETVIEGLLGIQADATMTSGEAKRKNIPALTEEEYAVKFSLYYPFTADVPTWTFVFEPESDVVKVYIRFYEGNPETAVQVPLLPPWQVVPDAPINQPPVLCSKKQIVSELYKLYLNLVQDAKKMHPEQFADEDYLGAAYEEWKEQMQVYKAAIQAL